MNKHEIATLRHICLSRAGDHRVGAAGGIHAAHHSRRLLALPGLRGDRRHFTCMLDAQFLAAIQVLIYIGAILVLIIFAVTLTRNANDGDERQSNNYCLPGGPRRAGAARGAGGRRARHPVGKSGGILDGLSLVPGVPVTDVSAIGVVLLAEISAAL